MRSVLHAVLILMSMAISIGSSAQDKIMMMSGSIIEGEVISKDEVFVEYEKTKNNGKILRLTVSRYEVFSIVYADGTEEVIYQPDFIQQTDYTEEEMRAYIIGEQDAYKNHHARPSFWGGVGLGLAAGYLGEGNLFITLGTPLLFSGANYIPNIRIRESAMSDTGYKYDNNYALGYERVARSRMLLSGLKGSTLGSFVGTTAFFIKIAND